VSRHLSIGPVIAVAIVMAVAGVVFVVLNQAFGGPSPIGGASYRLSATVPDSQGLVSKSLVLVRGVQVGEVASRDLHGDAVDVQLAIDPEQTPVYRDATVRVGHRTLFGEAYMDLDPGHPAAGRLPSGSRLPARAVLATQRVDDALEALDKPTRSHIRSLNDTGARVDADPRARRELNDTIGAFGDTLTQMRQLDRTLGGQRGDLRDLVSSSRTVLDELSNRREALSTVVSAGGAAAGALTADRRALRETIAGSAALLRSSRAALSATAPLIPTARSVVSTLNTAAPQLSPALERLRPVARSAGTLIRDLPAFNRTAVPFLRRTTNVAQLAGPVLDRLEPALRDLVPSLDYLGPYRHEILGFMEAGAGAARKLQPNGTTINSGTLADLEHYKALYDKNGFSEQGVNGAPYGWGRFFVDSAALAGGKSGIGVNPYPKPQQPYTHWDGHYPRLEPAPPVAP
jgi:phospholipid/cholesterol/gamma-HCH transport system substrate-binding protein